MMIDYSDHQPYREVSETPVLDGEETELLDENGEAVRTYKITEVGLDDDFSPGNSDQFEEYDQEHYDIRYGSGMWLCVWGECERSAGCFDRF